MEFMKRNGLFVALGANAALEPTPTMIAYGNCKAASHNLIQTLGDATNLSDSSKTSLLSHTFGNMHCLALLPNIFDSPSNRIQYPKLSPKQMINPDDVAMQIWEWMEMPDLRPKSGSLIKVRADTRNGG